MSDNTAKMGETLPLGHIESQVLNQGLWTHTLDSEPLYSFWLLTFNTYLQLSLRNYIQEITFQELCLWGLFFFLKFFNFL